MDIDIEAIARLIRLAEKLDLATIEVEQDGCRVTVKHEPGTTGALTHAAPGHHASADTTGADPSTRWTAVRAPMVGVFYRAPSPDAPPFVDAGDHVEVGQTLGMIEAMKVFSEIPSEVAGIVKHVAVENGTLVRPDEVLLYVAPDETTA